MIKVFLRNDDVFEADKNFILLNKIFIKRKIPVHHAIIPKKLSKSSVNKLIELKLQHPELIEYGQHGYSHKNYGNKKIKFEFLGRTYKQQKSDIENGKKTMEQLLGQHFIPVFSPPYHKYNEDTLRILDELNFRIFSADRETKFNMNNYKFSFIPVSLSFNIPIANINKFTTNLSASMKQFRLLKQNIPFVGIYLHHDMLDVQDFKNLMLFIKYLIKEDVDFCKLSDLGDKK